MRKTIILKDVEKKWKEIEIGEAFIFDRTLWITTHIKGETYMNVRLSLKDMDKLMKFLTKLKNKWIKEYPIK